MTTKLDTDAARARLLALLAAREGTGVATPQPAQAPGPNPVEPRSIERLQPTDRIPLSPAQEGLWFLEELFGRSGLYNIVRATRLEGPLDVKALVFGLQSLVDRHDSLRSHIRNGVDGPQVEVLPAVSVDLPVREVGPLEGDALQRAIAVHAVEPLDLTRGAPWRFLLLKRSASSHVLLVVVHHLFGDGWSMGILARELAHFYRQARDQGPDAHAGLEPLRLQFSDCAAWLRNAQRAGNQARELAYWSQRLKGVSPLELPTDRPRSGRLSHRGGWSAFRLNAPMREHVNALAAARGLTPFMVLLTVFKVLLKRLASQDDVTVGTPVAGRSRPEFESQIGYFANSVVLRSDLSGNPSFEEALNRVRHTTLDAFDHQDLSFERLVAHLCPERDLSRNPLFEVSFSLQSYPKDTIVLDGLESQRLAIPLDTAKFDLSLEFIEDQDELCGTFQFNSDLLDLGTIERWQGHFLTLLDAVLTDPSRRIDEAPVLTAAQRRHILVDWNDTARDYGRKARLHQLIEEQVAQTPQAVALDLEGQLLTYGQLNQRANQLARALRKRGVGPDVLVGVFAERSFEMVVALLAVLKAGGAYVPLDPAYPAERLGHMLEDARAPVVLAQSHLAAQLPAQTGEVLLLDASWAACAGESGENLLDVGTPDDLAYVIFTSGSTGRPKGAMNEHRSICNRLLWTQDEYQLTANDRVLQKTPFSFDVSVWEFFWPLLTGARLVIARPEGHRDSAYLADLIRTRAITTLHFVPSMLRVFLEEEHLEACGSLKRVLCSGEALPHELQERFFARLPGVELHNLYGPTEAAVDVTYWACRPGDERLTVPIGRPVANTQMYVLDARLEPVPIGVAGELYIGGIQVGRGYVGRDELTTQRFVPDRLSSKPGARLYKTGDLGRHLTDGSIEYLGRTDFQVKIRGQRIELGEIEATLDKHPGVGQSVVVAREDTPGDQRLVAYVVTRQADPTVAQLKEHLSQDLPAYMVPSAFVFLSELPLTSSGKVDRKALPAPQDAHSAGSPASQVPPRNELEQAIWTIWRDVLGFANFGVDDNFFDLGGHSLHAAQVASRVRAVTQREMPLRLLFEQPTVASLGEAIGQAGQATPVQRITARTPGTRLPLSYAQEGLWFLDQLNGASATYNVWQAVRLRGPLNIEHLQLSLGALVARHESLRTAFVLRDGVATQEVLPVDAIQLALHPHAIEGATQDAREQALHTRLASLAERPFDLTHPPLLRADLMRLGSDEHVLLLTLHHIISDGWSLGVLAEELALLYADGGSAQRLRPLAIQFGDYAVWQHAQFEQGLLKDQLTYWRTQLAGLEPLELPTDRPRPARSSPRGGQLSFDLDAPQVRALTALGQRENATLFMVMLGAWQVLLMRHSQQQDFAVGVPEAGRSQAELQSTIGYFVNMLVLRSDLSGAPSFVELLSRVRKTALEAFSHAALPFDKLVAELQPERDPSRNPLFQVTLSLQNTPDATLRLKGLEAEPITVAGSTAKFDLELSLIEVGERLKATLIYNSQLFDHSTIERMAGNFRVLVDGILADPTCAITRLPLLSPTESRQLLVDWNDTSHAYPLDRSMQQLFEDQAACTPDAVALTFGTETLSYAALNARANALAHRLRALGVGPDVMVGVCMERSFELIIGLLAVLKAGGAFMPMDPEYPAERLGFMLEDSRAPAILAQPQFLPLLGTLPGGQAEVIAIEWRDLPTSGPQTANLPHTVTAEDLSYVIFTSGSTGRPKGALNTHRGLTNHVLWLRDAMRITPADRIAHKTTISFDAAIWEVFTPLVCGAVVVLAAPGAQRDMAALIELVATQSVSVLQMVPSALRVLLNEPGLQRCRHLRYLNSGGEALDIALARAARQALPGTTLGNFYGPSEAADDAAWIELSDPLPERSIMPIGRPIANVCVLILDGLRQLVPAGVVGELHIGGVGVGRGYLNRPDLTAEKFVDDPFHPGQKLYRSGDLARHLADGTVEYVGRIDHQVKIRGQRVELGEIEAQLKTCPGVSQSAVLLREDRPGQQRLVAYVVADPACMAGLKAQLGTQLPGHMVPSTFIRLDALPTLPNGKLDRKSLPAPQEAEPQAAQVAPRNELEVAIWNIWRDVLGLAHFGVEDNFFDLGGHSLHATQVASRVRAVTQRDVPLRLLFEQPSVARLAEAIGQANPAAPVQRITARPPGTRLPLSYAQEGLWFLDQLNGASATYNVSQTVRLRGALNVEHLQRSLNTLVARHESLRSSFVVSDGMAAQDVMKADAARMVLRQHAIDDADGPSSEAALQALLCSLAQQPFDLTRAPLLRADLLRLHSDEHVLLLTLHHIISDGWSFGILAEELALLYADGGNPRRLAPVPIQFGDYAVWQHAQFEQGLLKDQLPYWRTQLAGLEPLELPTDRPRPARPSHRGGQICFDLDAQHVRALTALGQRENATLFMVMLGAWQVLLMRHSQQRDFAIGVPEAGRSQPELQSTIGYFVNMLALRSDLSGAPSFVELLARVRKTALEAFSHAALPFDKLVAELQPQRDPSRNPLFQVALSLQNTPDATLRLAGLQVEPITVAGSAAKFDLMLWLAPHGDGLRCRLEFASDLFDANTAERMAQQLGTLLTAIVDEPTRSIDTLPLLDIGEHDRLVLDWNQTQTSYEREACVHTLCTAQAARTPDRIAVVCGDVSLSFGELQARSHQLARLLRSRGIGRGDLVGLCVQRGMGMLVAQRAILEAGAAYVPLDPAYPAERLAYMAEDAQLALLVSDAASCKALSWPREQRVLLDIDAGLIASQPATALPPNPARDARALDPAYVIYTSGSTGRPKGVVVPHRGVVNFLASMAREPGLSERDRLLAVTTLSFDIAVLELLLPMSVGACIVLAGREQALDGQALKQLIANHGVTAMQATPSSWRMLIDAGWTGSPGFKALIGGEGLPLDLARQLLARCDSLWNLYGPTETTVWSTCWRVQDPERGISIGRPIANTQVHILDPQGQLCPIGVPGELHIGGAGVTAGYLRRPELSAEKFITDPFSSDPDARLYRTGDRARWRADGLLEHLGRLDFQVKVRGHRIELGEIEAQLSSHPDLARATVITREDSPGDVRIVAYVVAREATPDAAALRTFLRAALPEYMVPQHFVNLAALPLLPNGKLDRHALPVPVEASPGRASEGEGLNGVAEQTIAAVWGRLLGVKDIRASDNFFDLGGHSLLAMQAVAAIEAQLGVRLGVGRLVVESLGQLSASIDDAALSPRAAHSVPAAQAPAPAGKGLLKRIWSALAG